MKKNIFLDLLLTFMKISLFTFGGGYAMISIIENECVEKKKWITHDEMMNVTVVAESTPGPIAINCATFVGYRQAGLPGSVAATFGIVFPAFAVIYLISRFLEHFLEIALIAKAFQGIKIAVGLLILNAAFGMIQKMRKKLLPLTIMIGAAIIMFLVNLFSWDFSSIRLMILAALISLGLFLLPGSPELKGGEGK